MKGFFISLLHHILFTLILLSEVILSQRYNLNVEIINLHKTKSRLLYKLRRLNYLSIIISRK